MRSVQRPLMSLSQGYASYRSASQLGAVLFGVTYVGGDSAHVPGGEDTIGGWRDTGSAQHFADAQDLAWSTESDSEEEGTWAYGLDRDDLVGGGWVPRETTQRARSAGAAV